MESGAVTGFSFLATLIGLVMNAEQGYKALRKGAKNADVVIFLDATRDKLTELERDRDEMDEQEREAIEREIRPLYFNHLNRAIQDFRWKLSFIREDISSLDPHGKYNPFHTREEDSLLKQIRAIHDQTVFMRKDLTATMNSVRENCFGASRTQPIEKWQPTVLPKGGITLEDIPIPYTSARGRGRRMATAFSSPFKSSREAFNRLFSKKQHEPSNNQPTEGTATFSGDRRHGPDHLSTSTPTREPLSSNNANFELVSRGDEEPTPTQANFGTQIPQPAPVVHRQRSTTQSSCSTPR